jgi:hypothetical protein
MPDMQMKMSQGSSRAVTAASGACDMVRSCPADQRFGALCCQASSGATAKNRPRWQPRRQAEAFGAPARQLGVKAQLFAKCIQFAREVQHVEPPHAGDGDSHRPVLSPLA